MRSFSSALLVPAVAGLLFAGCVVVHTDEGPSKWLDGVEVHVDDDALEHVCLHEGRGYSPGASHCMGNRRMRCESGAWRDEGKC